MNNENWLFLAYTLPTQPAKSRVKLWRMLTDLGAAPHPAGLWILPDAPEHREALLWAEKMVADLGGRALWFVAPPSGIAGRDPKARTAEFVELLKAKSAERFAKLDEEIAETLRDLIQGATAGADALKACTKLERRVRAATALDFFPGSAGDRTRELLAELKRTASGPVAPAPARIAPASLVGKIWVTREQLFIDRLACAWAVLRFIDPKARFRFLAPDEPLPTTPEYVGFDLPEGRFTHVGDKVSFETLLDQTGLAATHPGLDMVAELVHEADVAAKPGDAAQLFADLLAGLVDEQPDHERIARVLPLFDALHTSFQSPKGEQP